VVSQSRVAEIVRSVQVNLQLVAGIHETIDVLRVTRTHVLACLDNVAEGAVEVGLVGWLVGWLAPRVVRAKVWSPHYKHKLAF